MKKDDAVALRERLSALAARSGLVDDGKLFHDEVAQTARWALRMSLPGSWPHAYEAPGLRLEAWFFAGKPRPDEEVLLAVVTTQAREALAPAFKELETGGKYARRYKPLEPLVKRFYPEAEGVCRRAPLAKVDAAWTQLVTDCLKPLEQALTAWDPEGTRRTVEAVDPLEALRQKFSR